MNSASESLYFGVPLVLFPQTNEQSGVAARVAELGAGLKLEKSRRRLHPHLGRRRSANTVVPRECAEYS